MQGGKKKLSNQVLEKEDLPMQNYEEPFHLQAYRCESGKIARILCTAIGSSVNDR